MKKQFISVGFVLVIMTGTLYALNVDEFPIAGEKVTKMEVNVTWTKKHTCSGPSPEMKLSNVPPPVIQFTVYLKDLNKPAYFHGGGIVQKRYNKVIKEGELKSYYGPCSEESHDFVFRVYGLDVDGRIIAYGEKILPSSAD